MPTLNFDVFWRDHGATSGTLKLSKATDQAARSQQQLHRMATALGLAAGAAIVKFGRDSVKAYGEAQDAQKKLGFAFQTFPKLADSSQAALQRLNSELQRKTRFDDDAIASGQAILAQFDLTGKQLEYVTPLLVDYASRTGKDIPAAAKSVGKALLGNVRALKDIGIYYKSTGDRQKDFTNITALLRKQVGGFAELEGKTFTGQLAIMKNQFGELEEAAGSKIVPVFSKIIGLTTKAVTGFSDLNPFIKGTVSAFAIGVPTFALALIGLDKLVGVVKRLRNALISFRVAATSANAALGAIGVVIGLASVAYGLYADQQAKATQAVEDYTEALKKDNYQISVNVRQLAAKKLQDAGAFDAAKKLGLGLDLVTDAALGNATAQDQVNRVTQEYIDAALNSADVDTNERANAAKDVQDAVGGQTKAIKGATAASDEAARKAEELADVTKQHTKAISPLKSTLGGLEKSYDALKRAQDKVINNFSILKRGALDQESVNVAWEESLDNLSASVQNNADDLKSHSKAGRDNKKAIKEAAGSLNIHTEAGRNNRRALIDVAKALNDKTVEDIKNGKSTKTVTERYKDNKDQLYQVAIKAGFNRQEAKRMIAQMVLTPKELSTQLKTPGMSKAQSDIKELKRKIADLKDRLIKIQMASAQFKVSAPGNNPVIKFTSTILNRKTAGGGLIEGPGTEASDSILGMDRQTNIPTTWVSNKEFVVNARQTRKNLRWLKAINNGFDLDLPHLRGGGAVQIGSRQIGGPKASGRPVARDITVRTGPTPSHFNKVGVFNEISATLADYIRDRVVESGTKAASDAVAAAYAKYYASLGTGLVSGVGWGPIYALARQYGVKRFTTYAGHDQGPARSRDLWPPSWAAARALWAHARALGIWYIIYSRRIASMTRPRSGWIPYTRSNPHTDHIHVTIYSTRHRVVGTGGGTPTASGLKGLAQRIMLSSGYGMSQWPSVNYIITRESGWRVTARNPSSGAYGLGQALPASKMRPYGPDYLHNATTQLRWFFAYIRSRYGSPSRAAAFWRSHHWYGEGGLAGLRGPELSILGDRGPERILNAQQTKKFDRFFSAPSQGAVSNTTMIFNFPHYVGSQMDLQRAVRSALVTMDRRGALTVIKRTA